MAHRAGGRFSIRPLGLVSQHRNMRRDSTSVTMEMTEGSNSICELMPRAGILELLALMEGGRERGLARETVYGQCVTLGFTLGTG